VRELILRTEGKTELVDITPLVREAIANEDGRAVVVFVPHTTAGIILQADGGLAVARDVETALERIVDESGAGGTPRKRATATLGPTPGGAHFDLRDDSGQRRRARPRRPPDDLLLRVRRPSFAPRPRDCL
jgi:Uncharacterised protein family UPF0047